MCKQHSSLQPSDAKRTLSLPSASLRVLGKPLQVAAAVALFLTAGPVLVLVNKAILRDNGLHLPAFVSAMGILFTSAFTHILVLSGQVTVKPPPPGLHRQLLPVGLCSAGTFMFGNLSYIFLDASFIQMLKAGTPALLLFMLVAFKVESISHRVGVFVLCMVAGSCFAVAKATDPSVMGLLVMLLSEVCEGLRCILTQIFLQKLDFSVWDAGYYVAPVTAACCLCLSAFTEFPKLVAAEGWFEVLQGQLGWLVLSGMIGIAVNFASFILIKLTSSLLTKLLVAARNAGLVLFFVIQGEPCTAGQAVGYCITLVAFTGYTLAKVHESRKLVALITKNEASGKETV